MTILKALVGGLLGGGLGAFASSYLQPMLDTSLPWTVLLAGLMAGLGVRIACGTGRSFLTGVIAAVTAILGIVGISYMDSMAMIRNAEADGSKPFVVSKLDKEMAEPEETEKGVEKETEEENADGESADGESAAQAKRDAPAENPVEDIDEELRRELSKPSGSAGTSKQQWISKEVIFDGLAALLAFMLGSGPAAATAAVAASNEETPPTPDQGGDA